MTMTDKDKTAFPDFSQQSEKMASDSISDIDFSFFDEPAKPAPAVPEADKPKQPEADSDFSFLESLIPTKPESNETVVAQSEDNNPFSFDDDPGIEDRQEADNGGDQEEHLPRDNFRAVITPREMVFACLKCASPVSTGFPETPAEKFDTACPFCSAQVLVVCESSALRASKKSGKLYCSSCSTSLDHHPHCPGCGLFCPDYYLVADPKEAQRKAKTARSNSFRIAVANLKASLAGRHDKKEPVNYETESDATAAGSLLKNRKMIAMIAGTAIALIVAAVSVFMYVKNKQEQQYIVNYVKTVYALHSGMQDMILAMNRTATEWKAASEGGKPYTPKPDSNTSIKLAKVVAATGKLVQDLQKDIPSKFEQPHARLTAYNAQFNSMQSAFMAPSTDLTLFVQQADAAEKSAKQKAQELKSVLPKEIFMELDDAKKRFRNFATF